MDFLDRLESCSIHFICLQCGLLIKRRKLNHQCAQEQSPHNPKPPSYGESYMGERGRVWRKVSQMNDCSSQKNNARALNHLVSYFDIIDKRQEFRIFWITTPEFSQIIFCRNLQIFMTVVIQQVHRECHPLETDHTPKVTACRRTIYSALFQTPHAFQGLSNIAE